MNLSAHPDDEDGATLAYYRMKYGVKTYSILFTRGEGGQNEIGPELYEELGVLRTAETRAAANILGTEVHFLNFKDFGFSKTATETFKKWGGATEPLRRLVYMIRKYKPDILFTHHNTVEGHGHHQVVAITAIAAFDAAADSTQFPEQLKLPGITLWQPRKLFFRNFGRTDMNADAVNQIEETDPLRQASYLEIAADALQQHRTQGMDRADLRRFTRGLSLYKLMRSNGMYDRDTTSFFGGTHLWSDPSLTPLTGTRDLLSKLHPGIPDDSLFRIAAQGFLQIEKLSMTSLQPVAMRTLTHWKEELENLVRYSCNISASWTFSDSLVVPTQKVMSTVRLKSPTYTLANPRFTFVHPQGWAVNETSGKPFISDKKDIAADFEVFIGDNATLTIPKTVALYNPIESEQNISAQIHFAINGNELSLAVRPRFDVAPFQTLSVTPEISRIASNEFGEGKNFNFRLTNFAPRKTAGRISVQSPPGWMVESVSYTIAKEDSSATGTIVVRPPQSLKPGDYTLRFKSEYARDEATVKVFDAEVDKNVLLGIIKSYDNTLESAAAELGLKYKLLDAKDLERNLSPYTTIVVDIRAYLVRDDLKKNNARLLEYVRNGGNLVVMYQKDQEWKSDYAPYPMQVSRKRVTVEEAPMKILQPDHPLFNAPNKITGADWDGWIQERGVYFPDNVAPEYQRLLSSNDPDEPPLTTGYLVANVGRGSYIYTSYVWYRQLKEYNPGAFRT
ncbi:MAG: PIG-L family deacetylase, partial [bacterium]